MTTLTQLSLVANLDIPCVDLDALEALLVNCDINRDEAGTCAEGEGYIEL